MFEDDAKRLRQQRRQHVLQRGKHSLLRLQENRGDLSLSRSFALSPYPYLTHPLSTEAIL